MLFVRDGTVMVDSRTVAVAFEKELKHVHEAIKNMIFKAPRELEPNFRPFKIKDLSGESTSHYEMTRDGFTLLAMGFTGEKALRWKLKYIEAFNRMEAELRAGQAFDEARIAARRSSTTPRAEHCIGSSGQSVFGVDDSAAAACQSSGGHPSPASIEALARSRMSCSTRCAARFSTAPVRPVNRRPRIQKSYEYSSSPFRL